jgi:hypothetical protein
MNGNRTCRKHGNYPSIVRGNMAVLRLRLRADGQVLDNLAFAIGARFVAVKRRTGIVGLDRNLAQMRMDDPETGTISVPLSSVETDIDEGEYDIAIQITWGAGDVLEWNFVEPLHIVKGIVP